MHVDDLHASLARLGLDSDETRIYVQLTLAGPARAGAAASATRLSRQNVYRALERLQTRGLVGLTAETPRRYEARPIDALFQDELRRMDDRRGELEALRDPVRAALDAVRSRTPAGGPAFEFALLRGRDRGPALARLLGDAKREVLVASAPAALHPGIFGVPAVRSALARLAAEGRVAVRAAVDVDAARWPLLAPLAEGSRCALRRLQDPPIQFVLVDDEALYVTTSARGESGAASWDAGLVATVPALATAHRLLFETLWSRSAVLVLPTPRPGPHANGAPSRDGAT